MRYPFDKLDSSSGAIYDQVGIDQRAFIGIPTVVPSDDNNNQLQWMTQSNNEEWWND